jgi:hypothetical protein
MEAPSARSASSSTRTAPPPATTRRSRWATTWASAAWSAADAGGWTIRPTSIMCRHVQYGGTAGRPKLDGQRTVIP